MRPTRHCSQVGHLGTMVSHCICSLRKARNMASSAESWKNHTFRSSVKHRQNLLLLSRVMDLDQTKQGFIISRGLVWRYQHLLFFLLILLSAKKGDKNFDVSLQNGNKTSEIDEKEKRTWTAGHSLVLLLVKTKAGNSKRNMFTLLALMWCVFWGWQRILSSARNQF